VLCAHQRDARAGAAEGHDAPQEFGHNFGDDYFLANYKQLAAYWQKLDRESDRMVLQSIGKTAEGREQLMAIVTSPENHKNLARYKDISRQLALAEGLTDVQARGARERKARPSSGSTAACTPRKPWARSSSAKWSIGWSARPTTRR
jgi:hypothetical protein